MSELGQYTASDGTAVIVAVPDESGVIPTRSAAGKAVREAVGSIEEALAPIRAAADDAVRYLREMSSEPARIEVQVGVCLTGGVSAIVASAGAGAQMMVTVVWERPQ